MDSSLVASDMMATNLVTLSPNMEIATAINILLDKRISGAPVVSETGTFQGIFSERSCMQFLIDSNYEQVSAIGLMPFVDDNPPTIRSSTDVLTIAQTFLNEDVRRLPVVDDGILVGQISRRDLMAAIHVGKIQIKTDDSDRSLYLSALHDSSENLRARLS